MDNSLFYRHWFREGVQKGSQKSLIYGPTFMSAGTKQRYENSCPLEWGFQNMQFISTLDGLPINVNWNKATACHTDNAGFGSVCFQSEPTYFLLQIQSRLAKTRDSARK